MNRSNTLRSLVVALLCAAALSCGSIPSPSPKTSPTPPPAATSPMPVAISSPTSGNGVGRLFGVGVHVINNENAQTAVFNALSSSSATSVRDDASWKYVEVTKGSLQIPPAWDKFVNEANAKSIKPILILDYGNKLYDGGDKPRSADAIAGFVRYATFVVNHFKGRIKYYELWNEWDVTTGGSPPGNPADYAALFNAAYPAIKRVDPSATVLVCAGLHGVKAFYDELAKLGVISKADGVAIHPYNTDKAFGPETSANYVTELEQSMVSLTGRSSVDIYVTEIGWSTAAGMYSENEVAEYASRTMLLLASLPYVKGVWWYDLKDDGQNLSNREDNFGLLHFDLSPKPAWGAYVDSVSYARSHRLSLSAQSNLKQHKVVIDVGGSGDAKSLLAWNLDSGKSPLYARCIAGKGAEVSADTTGGATPVGNPIFVGIEHGSCSTRALSPGHVSGR